jgi:hypothetical protein
MSLMQLLAVGKSLVGLGNQPSRYKMVEQNLLPKFAPVTRAGPSPQLLVKAEPVRRQLSFLAVTSPQVDIPRIAPEVARPPLHRETPPRKEAGVEHIALDVKTPADSVGKRKSFFASSFFSKSGAKRREELVQVELALETVRVVRNDLSDADVEVVRSRADSKASGWKQQQRPLRDETAAPGMRWSQLSSRLFETSQSRV